MIRTRSPRKEPRRTIQRIIDESIGLIDERIDAEIFKTHFPYESRLNEHGIAEAVAEVGAVGSRARSG